MSDNMDIKNMTQLEIIGANMRRVRKQKGFSVQDVKECLGLASVQSVYKWEQGKCMPQADNLLKLMEYYGVGPAELLEGISTNRSPKADGNYDLMLFNEGYERLVEYYRYLVKKNKGN